MISDEFIKYFGEEKWKEEEIITFLQDIVFDICSSWLNVEPIPVVLEEIKGSIAAFDNEHICIKVNPKYKNDMVTMVSAIVHELEHYYQLLYASKFNTPKARRWKNELSNYITPDIDPVGNVLQEIEIDAEAFAQIVLSCEYGIDYKNPIPELQEIIDIYIKSGKLMEE